MILFFKRLTYAVHLLYVHLSNDVWYYIQYVLFFNDVCIAFTIMLTSSTKTKKSYATCKQDNDLVLTNIKTVSP